MTITLYPKQESLVAATREAMRSHKSLILQAACGSGKTAMASWITKTAISKSRRVIFATHRKQILRQTVNTFFRNGIDYGIVGRDAPRGAMIGTMQSIKNRIGKLPADLLIIDEAHIYASGFHEVHEHYKNEGAWILALTATPMRFGGRGMGKYYDHIVLGHPVRQLIDDGDLSDYLLYAPDDVDTSELHVAKGEYVQREAEALMDKPTITGNAIATWRKRADGLRTIVFCVSIEHSKHVCAQYNEAGIPAAHMDANTPDYQRVRAIEDFADGRIKILSNCMLATEGFDLSAQVGRDVPLEAVQVLRPTKSLALFIQMFSRGLRKKPYPAVLLDHVGLTKEFGTVDMEREWSLEDRPKKQKAPPTYQCKECYGVFAEAFDICPSCGAVRAVTGNGRVAPEEVEGELQQVDAAAIRERKKRSYEVGQRNARTLEELQAYARSVGRKESWANYVWQARQNKLKRA